MQMNAFPDASSTLLMLRLFMALTLKHQNRNRRAQEPSLKVAYQKHFVARNVETDNRLSKLQKHIFDGI